MGDTYDFLRRNCCHFCETLAAELGPLSLEIPTWVNRLARTGASLADAFSSKDADDDEGGA